MAEVKEKKTTTKKAETPVKEAKATKTTSSKSTTAKKTATATKSATAKASTAKKTTTKSTTAKTESATKKTATKKAETKEVKAEVKAVETKTTTKASKSEKMVKITLVRSTIGALEKKQRTIQALGLRKIRSSVVKPDNACTRGMIFVVRHLVSVEEVK